MNEQRFGINTYYKYHDCGSQITRIAEFVVTKVVIHTSLHPSWSLSAILLDVPYVTVESFSGQRSWTGIQLEP